MTAPVKAVMSAGPITGDLDAPSFGMAYTKASKRSTIVRAILEISSDLASAQARLDDLVMLPEGPISLNS